MAASTSASTLLLVCACLGMLQCVLSQDPEYNYDIEPRTSEHSVNQGETVTLRCSLEFTGESPEFHYLEWLKTQDKTVVQQQNYGDAAWIEIVGVLGRLASAITERPMEFQSRYNAEKITDMDVTPHQNFLELTITNVQPEDSGWYMCLVPNNGFLPTPVIHSLFVREQIQVIELTLVEQRTQTSTTENATYIPRGEGQMTVHSDRDYTIMCDAEGGVPEPTVELLIGDTVQHGSRHTTVSLEGPEVDGWANLERFGYTAHLTKSIRFTGEHDQLPLVCKGFIDTHGERINEITDQVRLDVLYRPEFIVDRCPDRWYARVGDTNVQFACVTRAKPIPSNVAIRPKLDYLTQVNITVRSEVSGTDEYTNIFTIPRVTQDHFQEYILSVENEEERSVRNIYFEEGEYNGQNILDGSGASQLVSSMVAVVVSTLCLFLSS